MHYRPSLFSAIAFGKWPNTALAGLLALVFLAAMPAFATQTTTTHLSISSTAFTVGQTASLTVDVTGPTSTAPTGSVVFTANGYQFATAQLSNGNAVLTVNTSRIALGTYTLTATYTGNSSYSASRSTSITVTLSAPPPAGTPLSSCGDITVSGTYYLSQNLTSSGTCFYIDADNITLNLNGHTISYGSVGGSAATPAIMLADNWYNGSGYPIAGTGSTQTHGGFVVYGGNITAASNAAPRSAAIWVGQSNDISPAPVIHDIVMTTYSTDASPIFGTVTTSGFKIYNNTINYASNTTSSRYDLYGYAVWIADDPNAAGVIPDQIYNNKIIGAPQGGVFDNHQNAQIYNNDISFNSYYTNDYCVANVSGNNQSITGNYCHPASGRGIDVEAAGTTVSGNTIAVTELPQNAEYGGCELGGAYGIRIRDNAYQGNPASPVGVTVSDNTVTATAASCTATGLQMTDLLTTDSVTYIKNVVTSTGPGTPNYYDYAIGFDDDLLPILVFNGNTFQSVYAYVGVNWDGASVVINGGQTWLGSPSYGLDNEDGFYGGSNSPTFTQSAIVEGSTNKQVLCGPYSAGLTAFGSISQTCN